jgi:hypothetical protein
LKIIFDESVPERLGLALSGHYVQTVNGLGWNGTQNGKLLRLVELSQADVFVTSDKPLEKQQVLTTRTFGTVILSTNSWPLIQKNLEAVRRGISEARPGTVTKVDCGTFVPRRRRT